MKAYYAVLRYGHVGVGNEVSVGRYFQFPETISLIDVYNELHNLPGTKIRAVLSLKQISEEEYSAGKEKEGENFYMLNWYPQTEELYA